MKIAAIDIGTNSIHMVIVSVGRHRIFEIIDREKEMVFLGKGSLLTGRLPEENIARGLSVMRNFRQIADAHSVDHIIATATSAVREAENGKDFIERVKQETGVEIRLLPGKEEARMITLAVRDVIDLKDRRALIIDIGGGSLELIVADSRHIYFIESLKAGVIRLTERFFQNDPPTAKEIKKLQKWLNKRLEPLGRKIQDCSPEIFIGTSGTALACGEMVREYRKEGKSKGEKNVISINELEVINQRLVKTSSQDRMKFPGLDRKRVEHIVAGSILLEMTLEKCRGNELILCERALREGLIADFLIRRTPSEPARVQARELRSRSVINLLHRWEIDRRHMQHTSKLAIQLFDKLASLHKYGPRERELLEYAGLLHDIGRVISYPGHHRHGWYILRNSNLIGFHADEIDVMAAVVAYYRRKNPKKKDRFLSGLNKKNRRLVRFLSAILRVACGLDRQHNQAIQKLSVRVENKKLSIVLYSDEPALIPMRTALEQSFLLQKLLKLKQINFLMDRPSSIARPSSASTG